MTGYPRVQGRCPACRSTSLFLAEGGYVTCARATCPNPTALADLIEQDHHVADIGPDGWAFQHPLSCRPDLLGCRLHEIAQRDWQEAPAPLGRYRADLDYERDTISLSPLERAS